MAVETEDRGGAFPRLSPVQLATLEEAGERRPTAAGEVIFQPGDPSYDFVVVLAGAVAIVDRVGEGEERVIGVHGAGRFLGELNLLLGEAVYLTAVVREPGEVLVVPAARLREIVAEDPELGDLVLRAYLQRRAILVGLGSGLRLLGSRFQPETLRLREYLTRNRVPHTFLDAETDPAAEGFLRGVGVRPEETPVVISGERVLRNPDPAELARALGLGRAPRPGELFDLAVVGAGPSGLAAAVYGASEGLSTIVLDDVATGGQAGTSTRIENYLGFPSGISGAELAARAAIQAQKFGARFAIPNRVTALRPEGGHLSLATAAGGELAARCVVVATGARYRRLDVPRLEELEGNGVFYAATAVEAQSCAGSSVVVVGGGNSAGQAAVYLARSVERVVIAVRREGLEETMSRYLIDQVERSPRIELRPRSAVVELHGERELEALTLADLDSGARERVGAVALFVFIGADPCTEWLRGCVELDAKGFVLTDRDLAVDHEGSAPLILETSRPGVFAAGDARSGSIKRVASAVGEGSMVVRAAHARLSGG